MDFTLSPEADEAAALAARILGDRVTTAMQRQVEEGGDRHSPELLAELAAAGGNVVHVSHVRTGVDLEIDEVEIEVQVETKGPDHCSAVMQALRAAGYRLTD